MLLKQDQMMLVTVTGMFKEIGTKDEALRFFNRTFIIIPQGEGYCICNEQLHIFQPTEAQENAAKVQLANLAQVAGSPQVTPGTSMTSPQISDNDKSMLAHTLSQQTNMTLEWSFKCLEECKWSYENSIATFQTCLAQNQIPSEAFKH